MSVDDDLDALYGVRPEEFTARRKELSAAAKKRGDADAAKEIAAARRPTTAAWVVNRLVRADATAVPRLADLSDGLRSAHAEMDGARIRDLTAGQRKLVHELVRTAFSAADLDDPSAALRDEVTDTLQAAIADPDVAARLGRLAKAERYSGFGGFGPSAVEPVSRATPSTPSTPKRSSRPARPERSAAAEPAPAAPAPAAPKGPTAAERRAAAARVKRAMQEAKAARSDQERADKEAAERRSTVSTARRRYERLLEQLSEAEREVDTASSRLTDAEAEASAANDRLEAATSALAEAESAQAALDG